MTNQEYLKIEESFKEKQDNILTKLAMIAYITGTTILFLPFLKKSLFTAILIGIYLFCLSTFLLITTYYRFKFHKIYAFKSNIERKKWHYLYSKKQWRIRSINMKVGYLFLVLLFTLVLFHLGLKSTPNLLFNTVLVFSVLSLVVIVVAFILNFVVYKASHIERKRLEEAENKRMEAY